MSLRLLKPKHPWLITQTSIRVLSGASKKAGLIMTGDEASKETLSIRPGSDYTGVSGRPSAQTTAVIPDIREIGPYKLLEVLGEGGMGTIYLAEQTKPIHRRVALKIIKLGMDTRQVIARFESEREALAMMNHPNVAKVLDAGATETGRPYFVMEYVAGIPVTDYCDKHRLNTEERLRLFMDVCHAVQHAHQKGIIHRDIKPSNVLVAVQDGEPTPKVIDFGVAKATQHRLTERTLFTEQGQLIGTPGYMSPEQAEMTALDIDTRTDIYSLGVLLYELLVGALPFDTTTLLQAGFAEIQRVIREVDPPKPSTKLSSLQSERGASATCPIRSGSKPTSLIDDIAHRRHTEPRILIRQLRGDLDWIVMRAMEKDRTRRYDTANGLAMEIQRYLNNEPVLAGPPSATYRLSKFVRRNRASVYATTAVFLVVLAGAIVSTRLYFRAEAALTKEKAATAEAEDSHAKAAKDRSEALTAKANADALRSEAVAVKGFLKLMIQMADPAESLGHEVTVREMLDRGAKRIQGLFKNQPLVEAEMYSTFGEAYRSLGLYDLAEQHIRKALDLQRVWLGEEHRAVAVTMLELGKLLLEKGDDDNANRYISQGNDMLQGDRRGLDSLNMEAAAAMNRGDFRRSEMLYRQDLAALQTRLGSDHVLVGDGLYNLGVLLCRMEAFDEAERMYRDAIEIRRRKLPQNHPDRATSLSALGDLLVKTGRPLEAEPLLRESLEISRKVLPRDHWMTALSEATLGECLTKLGRHTEAEALLLPRYPKISRALGEGNRLYTRECAMAIIKLYESWDAAEPGKGFAEKTAEWREKLEETSKSQNVETPP